jgi:hypothetical protein
MAGEDVINREAECMRSSQRRIGRIIYTGSIVVCRTGATTAALKRRGPLARSCKNPHSHRTSPADVSLLTGWLRGTRFLQRCRHGGRRIVRLASSLPRQEPGLTVGSSPSRPDSAMSHFWPPHPGETGFAFSMMRLTAQHPHTCGRALRQWASSSSSSQPASSSASARMARRAQSTAAAARKCPGRSGEWCDRSRRG